MCTLMSKNLWKVKVGELGARGKLVTKVANLWPKNDVFLIHPFIKWSQICLRNYVYSNWFIQFYSLTKGVNNAYSCLKLRFWKVFFQLTSLSVSLRIYQFSSHLLFFKLCVMRWLIPFQSFVENNRSVGLCCRWTNSRRWWRLNLKS